MISALNYPAPTASHSTTEACDPTNLLTRPRRQPRSDEGKATTTPPRRHHPPKCSKLSCCCGSQSLPRATRQLPVELRRILSMCVRMFEMFTFCCLFLQLHSYSVCGQIAIEFQQQQQHCTRPDQPSHQLKAFWAKVLRHDDDELSAQPTTLSICVR